MNKEKFLQDFACLKIPILQAGKPTWPEKFDLEKIESIKKHVGERKFNSQMMLEPCDLQEAILRSDWVQFYEDNLKSHTLGMRTFFSLGEHKIISSNCVWDPSFNSQNSDNSVVSVVFFDDAENVFLHAIKYLPKLSEQVNNSLTNMEWQINSVLEFAIEHHQNYLSIESNGIGKFLPEQMRREIKKRKLNIGVGEIISHTSKIQRILGAFEPLLYAKRFYAQESLENSSFFREMSNFKPPIDSLDDVLDSVALAILEPRHLLGLYHKNRESFCADTNFSI
jgi:hypothetical protein